MHGAKENADNLYNVLGIPSLNNVQPFYPSCPIFTTCPTKKVYKRQKSGKCNAAKKHRTTTM